MDSKTEIPVLHNYKPYKDPVNCVYRPCGDTYNFKTGWDGEEVEAKIIGETDLHYITRIIKTRLSHPPHNEVMLPIGFHKTRLIKILPTQLDLFN